MKKFFKHCGIVAMALVVAILLAIFTIWSGGLFDDGRQPLDITVQETDSPFDVQDRQEDTRNWVEDRLNEAPRPSFRDNLQPAPFIEYDDAEPP